jgi:serine/threonine protein kinase
VRDERFARLKEILAGALDLPDEERDAYVASACRGDSALREEVDRILAGDPARHAILRSEGLGDLLGRALPTEMPAAEGKPLDRVGPYRILEPLGEGGMGAVYLAEQEEPIRRRVALKLIRAGLDTKSVLARFESERQALAVMDHPNIARIFDAGATELGRPFFAMELVRGDPITDFCDRRGLSTRDRLELFTNVCRAVQHAHHKGVIHRDLKPSNILVAEADGEPVPKVIDFGIAKAASAPIAGGTLMTRQGQLIGTPEYMSPEQTESGALDVDTRTDVYSLGVVLYELLTGARPFDPDRLRGASHAELQRIIREEEPPKPSTKVSTGGAGARDVAARHATDVRALARQLRGDLDWIVLKAMEKDRARRYDTANALALDIERYLRDEPVLARPPSATYRFRKFARRNRVGVAIASAVAFGVVSAAVGLTYALVESNRQRAVAERARAESEAVTAFLSGMLSAADPRNRGRDTPVGDLLDTASESIEGEFSSAPQVEAQLRATIGSAYSALGDYGAAEKHLVRALETQKRTLGAEDPRTLTTMNTLGILREHQGRYVEAESLHAGVLAVQRRVLGDGHPATFEAMTNLAADLAGEGRREEAVPLLRSAVDGLLRSPGEEDRVTLGAMNNLASLYMDLGRLAEAESLQKRVLAVHRRVLGDEDPETLVAVNVLATLYIAQRRPAEAQPLLEALVAARRRVLGNEHPETLTALNNLASLYFDIGRFGESVALHREVLETRRRLLGPEHPHTLVSMGNLGDAYARNGEAAKGEPLLAEAVRTAARVLGPGHAIHAVTLRKYGVCLGRLGRHGEAEAALLEARRLIAAAYGEGHDRTRLAASDLADLYESWGNEAEATRWRHADGRAVTP